MIDKDGQELSLTGISRIRITYPNTCASWFSSSHCLREGSN